MDTRGGAREATRVTPAKIAGGVRIGIVGTGAMAGTMMECFALDPRVRVVAVASIDATRARSFAARHGIAAAHGEIAALLARDDLDAVYIANATADHAATAIAALAAGKAVLCEKPFALDAKQGAAVAAAAKASGKLFMEAQWTLFLPALRELQRIVESGALGGSPHLYSDFGQSLDAASHPRLFNGPGAGVLLDFGVYPIVLALQLLGPVRSVRAALMHNKSGVDVQAALQLEHAGGGQSQLAASLQSALPNASVVSGSSGRAWFDSPVMGAEWLRTVHATPAIAPTRRDGAPGAKQRLVAALRRQPWLRRLKAARADGQRSEHPFGANRYLPQLQHFIALLERGALASDVMSIETSLAVVRVIDAARLDSPSR